MRRPEPINRARHIARPKLIVGRLRRWGRLKRWVAKDFRRLLR